MVSSFFGECSGAWENGRVGECQVQADTGSYADQLTQSKRRFNEADYYAQNPLLQKHTHWGTGSCIYIDITADFLRGSLELTRCNRTVNKAECHTAQTRQKAKARVTGLMPKEQKVVMLPKD